MATWHFLNSPNTHCLPFPSFWKSHTHTHTLTCHNHKVSPSPPSDCSTRGEKGLKIAWNYDVLSFQSSKPSFSPLSAAAAALLGSLAYRNQLSGARPGRINTRWATMTLWQSRRQSLIETAPHTPSHCWVVHPLQIGHGLMARVVDELLLKSWAV